MNTGFNPVLANILFKLYHAIASGKNGKIAAKDYVGARVYCGTQLAHNDISSQYSLPAETLDTPALANTVATVT